MVVVIFTSNVVLGFGDKILSCGFTGADAGLGTEVGGVAELHPAASQAAELIHNIRRKAWILLLML
jgi:hypothetical protein